MALIFGVDGMGGISERKGSSYDLDFMLES